MSSSFEKQLLEIVGDFLDDVDDDVDEAVTAAAKVGVDAIKAASPENRGKYKDGWTFDFENEKFGQHEAVIHNDAVPGLTHLLEHGREQFVGGRDTGNFTPGKPHIALGYQAAAYEMTRRMSP